MQAFCLFALCLPFVSRTLGNRRLLREVLPSALFAFGASYSVSYLAASYDVSFTLGTLVGITLLAWTEEILFRLWLPIEFAGYLLSRFSDRTARFMAVMCAQVVFATSHLLAADFATFEEFPWLQVLRLCTLGVSYWFLVSTAGLGVAAALHASLNLATLVPGATSSVSTILVGSGFGVGALALILTPHMPGGDRARGTTGTIKCSSPLAELSNDEECSASCSDVERNGCRTRPI